MNFPKKKRNYGTLLGSTANDICIVLKMKTSAVDLMRKLCMVLLGNLGERKQGRVCVFASKKPNSYLLK